MAAASLADLEASKSLRGGSEVKIIISKYPDGYFYIAIRSAHGGQVVIDDTAHSNLTGETEAIARAAALRGSTGWPIIKDYE